MFQLPRPACLSLPHLPSFPTNCIDREGTGPPCWSRSTLRMSLFRFVSIPQPFDLARQPYCGRDDLGTASSISHTKRTAPLHLPLLHVHHISHLIAHMRRDIARPGLLLPEERKGFTHPPSNFNSCFTLRRIVKQEGSRY